jgi:cell division protein FtsI (penicillin-binding protein 3)
VAIGPRVRLFRVVLVMLLIVVAARLVDVQVVHSAEYQAAGRQEQAVNVVVPALRGGIYDRNGDVLALSVPTKKVVADDFQIENAPSEAAVLSPLIGVPVPQLVGLLEQRSGYVVLATEVPATAAAKVAADLADARITGITLLDDSERVVPNGALAASLIGTTHASGAGASGLEYQYNRELAGQAGSETLYESPLGVALPQGAALQRSPSSAGQGIELTIDEPLQYELEQALGAELVASDATSATAEVMDVRTGDVLAMASLVRGSGGAGAVPGIAGVSESAQNLTLTSDYEPGSVFKLVTFSGALASGTINPSTEFSVPDTTTYDGSVFHDAEQHPTEELTTTQILAQSSNIGTFEIAHMLGESRLLAQVQNLGFGQKTALNFPGEDPGLIAGAAQWEPTNYVSLAIGQVDAVTAQQVLDAYNAVANGGLLVQPKLVEATIGADGRPVATKASASRRVFSPSVDAELTAMLEQVVAAGTGVSAVVPGYTVAGKTGTAQIPAAGGASYGPGAYMASFVGFAPATNPVLSAIVVLNRPTPIFGGTVAAPVFSQVMSYALHRYDIPTTAGASSQAPPATAPVSQSQDIT